MGKGNLLFDPSKFEARKTADQQEFEDLHKDDLADFRNIMEQALEMTEAESKKKRPHFKNKNYNATVMNGNISGLLRERFPGFVKDGPNDRIMFSRKGKYCIYFKKLDSRKMPSNVRTEYAELIAYQKTIPGGDKMPIIFVGYTVDVNWSEITGVYAVYIQENKRVWVTIINEGNAAESAMPVIGIRPVTPVAPKAKRVRRKTS